MPGNISRDYKTVGDSPSLRPGNLVIGSTSPTDDVRLELNSGRGNRRRRTSFWPISANWPSGRFWSGAAHWMSAVRNRSRSDYGRLGDVAKDRFGAFHCEVIGVRRTAAIRKADRPQRVVTGQLTVQVQRRKAVVEISLPGCSHSSPGAGDPQETFVARAQRR